MMAEVMVGMKTPVVKQKEEGKGVNMCEALRGMLEDSRVEEDALRLIGQVQRKYTNTKKCTKRIIIIIEELFFSFL